MILTAKLILTVDREGYIERIHGGMDAYVKRRLRKNR
jgi:hypothetical protein